MASKVKFAPFSVPVPEGERGTLWDSVGSLLDYAGGTPGENFPGVEWREIKPFHATLKVTSMRRGRSAAQFVLSDVNGAHYPMFMIDALDLMLNGIEPLGVVTATWIVVKRGQNYGIRVRPPSEG